MMTKSQLVNTSFRKLDCTLYLMCLVPLQRIESKVCSLRILTTVTYGGKMFALTEHCFPFALVQILTKVNGVHKLSARTV